MPGSIRYPPCGIFRNHQTMETRIMRRGVNNEVTGRIQRGVWSSGSIRGGGRGGGGTEKEGCRTARV